MIRNYIKIVFRNLSRQKLNSVINILGLAVGIAASLLILLWIRYELSYDTFHENSGKVYRVNRYFYNEDGSVSIFLRHVAPPIGPLLEEDFPEIKRGARLRQNPRIINLGEKYLNETNFYFAEPGILDILSFEIKERGEEKLLVEPNTVLLSEKAALKYFGGKSPLGEFISMQQGAKEIPLKVTGVIKDYPSNSHIQPDFLVSFSTFISQAGEREMGDWSSNNYSTYLLLTDNYDAAELEPKLDDFIKRHLGEKARSWTSLSLEPLTEIHSGGAYEGLYIMGGLALMILLIACINFMNLATARYIRRAKEVGVRKTIGADRITIIKQFLLEALITTFLAAIIALFLVEYLLPGFNNLFYSHVSFDLLDDSFVIPGIIGIILTVGFISGLYPALYLSSFQPATIIRSSMDAGKTSFSFRNILVVFQFSISIFLIICVIIVGSQLDFLLKKNLGYQKENLLVFYSHENIHNSWESFSNKLKRNPGVISVTRAKRVPSGRLADMNGASVYSDGEKVGTGFSIYYVRTDYDYFKTFEIPLAAGRAFSREYNTDINGGFILNETAIKLIGWKSPNEAVGKRFVYGGVEGQIIGVTEDFHFESLHNPISPIVFILSEQSLNQIIIRLLPGTDNATIKYVEELVKDYAPKHPFSYSFIEERLQQGYIPEEILGEMLDYTAILAVLIACLGLYGLVSYTVEQKTKEIGIRKVLGASVPALFVMLTGKFSRWALFANIIAWPLGYWIMNNWLEDFAYRVDLSPIHFVSAGIITLVIALGASGIQSVRAAMANPVDSLRDE